MFIKNIPTAGKVAVALVALVVMGLAVNGGAQAQKTKSYYSGDAIAYRDQVVVASTNMGYVEIFRLGEDALDRVSTIRSTDAKWNTFYGVALQEEADGLYAYATTGRYLNKYDISNLSQPKLVKSIRDNSWDWFFDVVSTERGIMTVGTNDIKLWNNNLQTILSYPNERKNPHVSVDETGRYIADITRDYKGDSENDFIALHDFTAFEKVGNFPIVLEYANMRDIASDSAGNVYVVGDRVLKRINSATGSVSNFRHTAAHGYDVEAVAGKPYVYFSDGVGIVKMSTVNFQPIDWMYSNELGEAQSWAMGIEAVTLAGGQERLVVFNSGNIVVLDSEFNVLGLHTATEPIDKDQLVTDPLSLTLSTRQETPGDRITVSGQGFGSGEEVAIAFVKGGYNLSTPKRMKTDAYGRFSTEITVPVGYPEVVPERLQKELPVDVEVRATGVTSGSNYGTSFKIVP